MGVGPVRGRYVTELPKISRDLQPPTLSRGLLPPTPPRLVMRSNTHTRTHTRTHTHTHNRQ